VAFLFSPHAFGLLRPSFEGNGGSKAGAMSSFKIADIAGEFDHQGPLGVKVIGDDKNGFSVALLKDGGAMSFQFHLSPDQSRRLRSALEDAEAKAEILTAAI